VLVDVVRFTAHPGRAQYEERYGAVLLARNTEPVWVTLGPAAPIDAQILVYQKILRGNGPAHQMPQVLQDLSQRIWTPLAAHFPKDTQAVVLSPDAALNFVSFATLLAPDGEFVADKYLIQYAASGRDLLKGDAPAASPGLVVFANPSYQGGEPATAQTAAHGASLRLADAADLCDLSFPSLPNTQKESELLTGLARDARWPVTVYAGTAATKAQLCALHAPRILHIATHGFFLPDSKAPDERSPFAAPGFAGDNLPHPRIANPMYRSGLAFAGAQSTVDAWKRGEEVPAERDGVLTAAEVGTLDLHGTWLVVLSACDTGAGDSLPGEGVLGLRRGFVQAGAQNLLMTLWPVPDAESAQFMGDFYGRLVNAGQPGHALAETQRAWLKRLRAEQGLLQAVKVAGPFILTSQGSP